MIKRFLLAGLLSLFAGVCAAQGAGPYAEGASYFRVTPPQPTTTPGKIEVLEVFSYACPACNQFQPFLNKLKAALPADAELAFLPAAFNPGEDWPVFQRGFLAAQSLGIAEKSHDAMFDAVWGKGTLALMDKTTHRWYPQDKQPTINDLAKFYSAYGVKEDAFLAMANSFKIDSLMRRSDQQVKNYEVDGTPSVIVNGKYRVTPASAGGYDKVGDVVLYLVAQERKAKGR